MISSNARRSDLCEQRVEAGRTKDGASVSRVFASRRARPEDASLTPHGHLVLHVKTEDLEQRGNDVVARSEAPVTQQTQEPLHLFQSFDLQPLNIIYEYTL